MEASSTYRSTNHSREHEERSCDFCRDAAMVVSNTPAKQPRPTPFTPKRPLSSISSTSSSTSSNATTSSDLSARLARTTPSLLSSTHKKYKASISSESRTRTFTKANVNKPTLAPVPRPPSRPRTPGTPNRKGAESPSLMPATSEMDVSRVDPEEVLVDYQTVEPGDISGELDEAWLRAATHDHGKEDKVMVSIRIRPTDGNSAWIPVHSTNTLKVDPTYAKSATTSTQTFNFDSVLTGTPNKPIYTTVARSHVHAAMEGFNAVIFAYGQTASGKTFTLSGDDTEPGIIPRAMRDVFGFIRRTPEREYLLRCSYLEIYNESIHDLLAPPSSAAKNPVQIQGGAGSEVLLTALREEVVTSLKGVKEVLRRGEGNRRTACTDWNDRSSRSHSIFRMVIESRERGSAAEDDDDDVPLPSNGRHTPGTGRNTPGPRSQTPGMGRSQTPGPGGPRLQARGGRSVQTSVLSLIDLAGSEKATSDKDRTREGKYINTSLLTLGTVIGTLADNAAKHKTDHVPYRNSKLTRMLQPSLSGNARISVICTINPDPGAISESLSTLQFAKRIKNVQLNAQKKEIVDTDALIERYRKEIEDLKTRLAEREAESPVRKRRLSAREQVDESKAMKDLNTRIQQLTKLILTSQTVDESKCDESRPGSPVKIDFDMSPYQLQQELLSARLQAESQATQILSLEAALDARPPLPTSAPENEKDRLIQEQNKTIKELEIVVRGYEENLGEPLRAVREDVEKEWKEKLREEVKKFEEKERWADELVKQLEKEKKMRLTLEEERRALAAFVSKFDSLGLGLTMPSSSTTSKLRPPMPTIGSASAAYAERRAAGLNSISSTDHIDILPALTESPIRMGMDMDVAGNGIKHQIMLEQMPEGEWSDVSFEQHGDDDAFEVEFEVPEQEKMFGVVGLGDAMAVGRKAALSMSPPVRAVLGDKENLAPVKA
ncbi:hypothetical protein D9615_006794 [Tricholomella constricta]|uniref:Kinesin-like protein n=1 Tax=Tricholomella constricta TaxID=117010 RepID=A0A8H5M277_9AGAR|nr:hypothetical protein D9615_006794 [Tricholomella constricta]